MSWRNPRWGSLRGPDAEVLRAVFKSLEDFLADPTFYQGVRVGDGRPPGYDPATGIVTPPPTVRLDGQGGAGGDSLDTTPPTDPPGNLQVKDTIRGLLVLWDEDQTADVVGGNGSYHVEVSTDGDFTTPFRRLVTSGNFASFADLTQGTTYHVRVRAVDARGNAGPWAGPVTQAPAKVARTDIASQAVSNTELADFAVTVRKFNTRVHQIY